MIQKLRKYWLLLIGITSFLVIAISRGFNNWNDVYVYFCISISALMIVALILWEALFYHLQPQDFANKKDFIDLFIKIIGGTTLLISLFTVWKGITDTQIQLDLNKKQLERNEEVSRETLKISKSTLDANREHQIEERYYKAIEKLNDKDIGVRMGAIYALGKIAEDSEKHYWLVMQILTGYVRDKYAWSENSKKRSADMCPPDLQAVFNIIGWRKRVWKGTNGLEPEPQRLDLTNTDLRGLMLRNGEKGGAHLEGIRFIGADLEKADLMGAFLEDAVFDNANLQATVFAGAHFNDTSFENAIFDKNTDFMATNPPPSALSISGAKKGCLEVKLPPDIRKELIDNYEGGNECK